MSATRRGGATVLAEILRSTEEEIARRKRTRPLAELEEQARSRSRTPSQGRLRDALTGPRIALIAEFKRRAPSAGTLREQADVAAAVAAYERGGASAASILTEGPHFGGSLEDLRRARAACALPLLRKDFIVDPYQLHEALAADADAVLLIVAALEDARLAALHEEALALGLDALVEVHDRVELARALECGARLVGVNNRDLRDFSVDVETTLELRGAIPDGVLVVSESGIETAAQLRRLQDAGVDAALVGGALMRSADQEVALRALLEGVRARPGV